jgi:hypothetical protein
MEKELSWQELKRIKSNKYDGLHLGQEKILEGLMMGNSPTKVAQVMGIHHTTVFKQVRENSTFQQHFTYCMGQRNDIVHQDIMGKIEEIIFNGKSDNVTLKGAELWMKANNKLQEQIEVINIQRSQDGTEVNEILKSLGVNL